jgi:hypothetical protein
VGYVAVQETLAAPSSGVRRDRGGVLGAVLRVVLTVDTEVQVADLLGNLDLGCVWWDDVVTTRYQ